MSDENLINNEEVIEEQDPIIEEAPVEEEPIEETPVQEEDTGPKWYDYDDPEEVNFIGTKFIKPDYDQNAYAAVAGWCNETQKAYIIESEDGTYYEVVAVPELEFEEVKERKLLELGYKFEEAVKGSFTTTEGYVMQFDISDCEKMNGSITLNKAIGITSDYLVQANDVVIENVSMETMENVLLQMLKQYKSMHLKKQIFRAQINACTTKEELDNIDLTF